jgi:hypothetical protein
MITRPYFKVLFTCLGITVLAVCVLFLVQNATEKPEAHLLLHDAPPAGPQRGKVALSLSSAMVTLRAGPPGEPLRVESNFDPDVYTLAHRYEEDENGDWTYDLDFHERSLLHVSVIGVWLGKRSPEVTVVIPANLPFDLEATMKGGYLVMDFAEMALSYADVELNRGVLQIFVSDQMDAPMERLSVRSKTGTLRLSSIGNASPGRLDVQHRFGAARVDLQGQWRTDADIDLGVAIGTAELRLPGGVTIDGLGLPLGVFPEREIPLPTLRIGSRSSIGKIRVTY